MNLHELAEQRRRAVQSRNGRRVQAGLVPCPECPQTASGPRTWLKPQLAAPSVPERSSNDSEQVNPFNEAQDVPPSDPVVEEYLSRVIGRPVPAPEIVPQPDATPVPQPENLVKLHKRHGRGPRWAVGVTCVPERFDDLLPQTLVSIKRGGFTVDRLFCDGLPNADSRACEVKFGIPVTARHPRMGIYGNWCLGLAELLIRDPGAERFAMFQDDVICVTNLRQYLESEVLSPNSYANCYTFEPGHPGRQSQLPPPDPSKIGWYRSNQLGRGALCLIFDRHTAMQLLKADNSLRKSGDGTPRGKRNLDGAIITSMKDLGVSEVIHNPSLVDHLGHGKSTLGNVNPLGMNFPGESHDAREWIKR